MLNFYQWAIKNNESLLRGLLKKRVKKGKELPERLEERKGFYTKERPDAPLLWLHAASVGEAQSALILIERLLNLHKNLHILVTTGTVSSAELMGKKLPSRAFHQFYPLDHPDWVSRFLDHWQPDLILWMESELWPNMLLEIKNRGIPAALINARLSPRSYARWKFLKKSVNKLLSTFSIIMTQTPLDKTRYEALGARNVIVTDNLKYSANPLPADEDDLLALINKTKNRPIWVYASTHKGEEKLACRIHEALQNTHPDLLTIIVPRHPERRDEILKTCEENRVSCGVRSAHKKLPDNEIEVYIADTLGELGLFYKLCPVAVIGRSLSDDGGGGHNPLEAALLNCAVLHGPHIQNLQDIYDEMDEAGAAITVQGQKELIETLTLLLGDQERLRHYQETALHFAQKKNTVIERVLELLRPLIENSGMIAESKKQEKVGKAT